MIGEQDCWFSTYIGMAQRTFRKCRPVDLSLEYSDCKRVRWSSETCSALRSTPVHVFARAVWSKHQAPGSLDDRNPLCLRSGDRPRAGSWQDWCLLRARGTVCSRPMHRPRLGLHLHTALCLCPRPPESESPLCRSYTALGPPS